MANAAPYLYVTCLSVILVKAILILLQLNQVCKYTTNRLTGQSRIDNCRTRVAVQRECGCRRLGEYGW